jgi:filamin
VERAPADAKQSKVHGKGVDGPIVQGEDAPFTIESYNRLGGKITTGGDQYKVVVTGPNNRVLDAPIKDLGNGTYSVTYKPVDYGQHKVEVTLHGQPVAASPYTLVASRPAGYPSALNCYAEGEGLTKGNTAEPAHFTIHARDEHNNKVTVAQNPFVVTITAPNGDDVDADVKDNHDSTYSVTYQANKVGKHTIVVGLKNPVIPSNWEHIKDSPFHPTITQGTSADKTVVYGPGIEDGVKDNEPTHFTIEARDPEGAKVNRGGDPFDVKVQGPSGPVPAKLKDNGDGTYRVEYAPEEAGPHRIDVTLKGKPVAKSPYHVNVVEGADWKTSGIKHYTIVVQARNKRGGNMTKGGDKFTAKVGGHDARIEDRGDGTYVLAFDAPTSGFKVDIEIDGKNIKNTPLSVSF